MCGVTLFPPNRSCSPPTPTLKIAIDITTHIRNIHLVRSSKDIHIQTQDTRGVVSRSGAAINPTSPSLSPHSSSQTSTSSVANERVIRLDLKNRELAAPTFVEREKGGASVDRRFFGVAARRKLCVRRRPPPQTHSCRRKKLRACVHPAPPPSSETKRAPHYIPPLPPKGREATLRATLPPRGGGVRGGGRV